MIENSIESVMTLLLFLTLHLILFYTEYSKSSQCRHFKRWEFTCKLPAEGGVPLGPEIRLPRLARAVQIMTETKLVRTTRTYDHEDLKKTVCGQHAIVIFEPKTK